MALKLVKQDTTELACTLIEDAEQLFDSHMSVSRSLYGENKQCLAWYFENESNDQGMRIVFDKNNDFLSRQGIHLTLEIDEYELLDSMEKAFDDGFGTIWLHVNFNQTKAV